MNDSAGDSDHIREVVGVDIVGAGPRDAASKPGNASLAERTTGAAQGPVLNSSLKAHALGRAAAGRAARRRALTLIDHAIADGAGEAGVARPAASALLARASR